MDCEEFQGGRRLLLDRVRNIGKEEKVLLLLGGKVEGEGGR